MSIQRYESVWLILVLLAETVHFSKEYRWHHCIYTAALVDRAMTTRITEHSGLKRPNSDLIKSFYVMSFWSSFLLRSRRWNLCAYRAHPTFELDSAAWRRNPSREETYWQRPFVHHVVRQHASILYNLQQVSCPLLNMFELASMPLCCETRSSPVQQEHRGLPHHLRMVMFWSQSIKRGVFLAPPSVFLGNLDYFRPFSTFSWHFGTFLHLFFPWQYKTCSCATGGDWSLFSKETSVWLSGSKHGLLWPKDAEVFLDRSCQTRYIMIYLDITD